MPRLRPRVEDQPRLAHPLRLTRDQRHNPNSQGDAGRTITFWCECGNSWESSRQWWGSPA